MNRMETAKLKSAVVVYLAGMVMIHAAVFWNVRESVRKGYSDFTIYYCAGTMVRQGLGHQLYDEGVQYEVQRQFSPQVAIRLGALPYNHPPFEAAFFAPLTYLSYPSAFVLWDLVNVGMLAAIPCMLRPHLPQLRPYSWPLWFLASLGFSPIFFALLQGQDAILLLLLYTLAFVCLKRTRDVLAGVCLGFALFKPHLVLPFVFLLLVQGRKKVLSGFLFIMIVLGLISWNIVGWRGMMLYPSHVLYLEETMAKGAISDMPNLRGMLDVLFHTAPYTHTAILGTSLGLLLFTAWQCHGMSKKNLFDLKFSLAVIATILVSYHALVYDLSVLILAVWLLANDILGKGKFRGWRKVLIVTAITVFVFAPLQLFLSLHHNGSALLGWVLLLWLFGIVGEISFQTSQDKGLQNAGVAG
jgi:hypothetical protein